MKIYRDGVDIKVAFAAVDSHSKAIPAMMNTQESLNNSLQQTSGGHVGQIQQIIRFILKPIYKMVRRMIRPIAIRVKKYLTEDLHQQMNSLQEQQLLQWQNTVLKFDIQFGKLQQLSMLQDLGQLHHLEKLQDLSHLHQLEKLQELNHLNDLGQLHYLSQLEVLEQFQQKLNEQTKMYAGSSEALTVSRLDRIEQYVLAAARRSGTIACGIDDVLVRTEVGYVLCSRHDYAVLACLLETGDMEPGTRLLIERFLKPGDVFVDVGAHLGLHTLAAARAVAGTGKVIAFEPFESTRNLLEKSIWLNGFSNIVETHQAAVSNCNGSQQLFIGKISSHHSLFPLGSDSSESTSYDVKLVKLDDIITDAQTVTLIKIDAEGAELDVLQGAGSIINRHSDIGLIVEFGPSHLQRTGKSVQEWFDAFAQLGLQYKIINANTGTLEDWAFEKLEHIDSANLFFAREGSSAWARLI